MNDLVCVQASGENNDFLPLARSQSGKLFRKQILSMNSDFVHPGNPAKKIHVDQQLADSLVRNFKSGVCPIVQVPVVDDANSHSEDPNRNIGEVVDLTYDDKGVYVTLDARKHAEDIGKTLLGASALMHMNYTDTLTGRKVGPTLLHTALTNRPYLTNLADFEEVAALSADTQGDKPVVLVPVTNTEEVKMELDQMLTILKDEHGIDVAALQATAAEPPKTPDNSELVAALSNVVGSATGHDVLTIQDVADAVIELAEERVALSDQVNTLNAANEAMAQKAAEDEVDDLVRAGRVLPKQRDAMVSLSRNDRTTFDALVPDEAIVALSEEGVTTFDAAPSDELQKNIDRLADALNSQIKK